MERLTNICSNGEIWITNNDETRRNGRKESAYKRLASYEDLDEQGLLLRLPCKVGDTVYSIANDGKIYPVKATREVRIVNGVLHIICESCRYSDLVSYDDVGETVFLTQAEAEQKLKEMESD